ncbi:MAG: hypothetical protein ACREP0_05420 [Rhodanobacteraceae bacterium]
MHSIIHRNTLGDLPARTATRLPHKTALVWRGQRDASAELGALINRCANAIAARDPTER